MLQLPLSQQLATQMRDLGSLSRMFPANFIGFFPARPAASPHLSHSVIWDERNTCVRRNPQPLLVLAGCPASG